MASISKCTAMIKIRGLKKKQRLIILISIAFFF